MKKTLCFLLISAFALGPLTALGAQTAQARLYCLSFKVNQGIDEYRDTMDINSTGAPDGAGEMAPFQYPPFEIFIPPNENYASMCWLWDSLYGDLYSGTIYMYPPLADNDNNRVPDFFEVSKAFNATVNGYVNIFTFGYGYSYPPVTWTRAAGSRTGRCLISINDGFWGTFTNTFEIMEYTGTCSYTPGTNTVSGSVNLSQTGNPANTFRGPISFVKADTDRFNSLTNQAGFWTNASGQSLAFTNHWYIRDVNWPTNYSGLIEFTQDPPTGMVPPYGLWVLSINDPNDANHNGIPDLSDDPQTAPPAPRRPQLSLARRATDLVLTIRGDINHVHNVLEAGSITSTTWNPVLSVTLTNDPQTVSLPIPATTKFWRVTAQ